MERDRFFGDTSLIVLAVFGLIAMGLAQSSQGAARLMFYIAALLGFAPLVRATVLRMRSCLRGRMASMERISAAYRKAGRPKEFAHSRAM